MWIDRLRDRGKREAGLGGGKRSARRGTSPRRFARPVRLEQLEGRMMLSGGSIVGLGVAGDSLSDEYAGEWYSYASNWVELLAEEKGVNLGAVDDWGEPRREGYEHNWARAGATSGTLLLRGQHTGLAQQVNQGKVSHAVLAIGQNDFLFALPAYLGIYSGGWPQSQIDAYCDTIAGNVNTALGTLTATDADLVLSNVIDYGVAPITRFLYPNATKRDRVAGVIDNLNDRIEALARQYQVPMVDAFAFTKDLLGTNQAPIPSQPIGGQTITNTGGIDPHNAFVFDGIHPHTVPQAIFANLFLEAFSLGHGTGVAPFTEAEMVGLVGLPYGGADTLDITYSDYVVLPTADHQPGTDTPGLYNPSVAAFYLKNSNAPGGGADVVFRCGPAGNRGWIPLAGDWDGDGVDTVGLYDPSAAAFHLKNSNASGGGADLVFRFGPRGGRGWQPVVGDFDGDGIDTVGLYDPGAGGFHLKNSHVQAGGADLVFRFGPRGNRGWTALAGDWNHDGIDTVGLYDPGAGGFHLKSSHAPGGGADVTSFRFGPTNAGWRPLAGDFDAEGTDTVGLYAPGAGAFHLKNSNTPAGGADLAFRYGPRNSNWTPLTGNWDGPTPPQDSGAWDDPLLRSVLAAALASWDSSGIPDEITEIRTSVIDFIDTYLNWDYFDGIRLDWDAAWQGWTIDVTLGIDPVFTLIDPAGNQYVLDPPPLDQLVPLDRWADRLQDLLGRLDLDLSLDGRPGLRLQAGLRQGLAALDAFFARL